MTINAVQSRSRSVSSGIVLVAAALLSIGLISVASASASLDRPLFAAQLWRTPFGRQVVFALVGLLLIILTSRFDYRRLRWRDDNWPQPTLWLLVLTLLCLGAVLVPGIGVVRNGARRWLQFGPAGLGFQPSELAKLTLVLFLAAFLGSRRGRLTFWRGVLPGALAIAICVGLVGTEDFGTAALLAAVSGLMLLVAGARWWHLLTLGLPAAGAFVALLLARPYRLERLTGFANIWSDPRGDGYHAIQSLVTIASGGWTGRGLGEGIQKYGYLPEARTDFVFAIWHEETGVVGALVVLALFGVLLVLGTRAAQAAPTAFGRLLAVGVTLMVTLQAVMNVAVVTASAPTKGIALPLVSAGGSGVIFLGGSVGLLAGVALRGQAEVAAPVVEADAPDRAMAEVGA